MTVQSKMRRVRAAYTLIARRPMPLCHQIDLQRCLLRGGSVALCIDAARERARHR